MGKTWQQQRYDFTKITKAEESFETGLKEKGFEVIGIKEWGLKTDYYIKKDGIELQYTLWVDSKEHKEDKNNNNLNTVIDIYEGMKAVK